MRRIVGLVLVALGVALIALAIALPTFVYPRVAKVPENPDQTLTARGTGVTVLLPRSVDQGGTRLLRDQTVTNVRRVVGQVPPGGAWTLDFPGIDDARYDKRWVARFVSAYMNGDVPTGEALFGAAIADGQLPDCLLALAGSTVATLRHRAA